VKIYRLYTGCDGEYSCDYYRGLFKTVEPMLSFVEEYMKEERGKENISAILTDDGKIFVNGIDNEWHNPFGYEIIDTDNLQ